MPLLEIAIALRRLTFQDAGTTAAALVRDPIRFEHDHADARGGKGVSGHAAGESSADDGDLHAAFAAVARIVGTQRLRDLGDPR